MVKQSKLFVYIQIKLHVKISFQTIKYYSIVFINISCFKVPSNANAFY